MEMTAPAAHRNTLILATCQALQTTANVVLIALNGLAGQALAENKSLATLPVTAFVVGGALFTMPASLLMQRIGRARGFSVGAVIGILGALVCAYGVHAGDFWLLCAGNLICGAANACASYYRFAAADAAPDNLRERAISLVLAGGLVGGVLGPESTKLTKDLLPQPFLGSYASLLVLMVATLLLVQWLKIPPLSAQERAVGGRPMLQVASQPAYIVAVLCGAISYAVMNLLMTATPLAMQSCHHPYPDAALVIQWHVIGMYAPAFVTGRLIQRFGLLPMMLAGTGLMFACVGIALSGNAVWQFWSALVVLGVGWNFLYVGATTLLTQTYAPAERAKAQGLNDLVMFTSMGVSSLSAGLLVTNAGWNLVNYASLPFLIVATMAIIALKRGRGSHVRHAP